MVDDLVEGGLLVMHSVSYALTSNVAGVKGEGVAGAPISFGGSPILACQAETGTHQAAVRIHRLTWKAPTNDEHVQQIAAVLELALISQHPSYSICLSRAVF